MDFNIFLFNDFETLDIFGPIEVFASKENHRINYYSIDGGVIVSRQGAKIITDKISNANKNGVLVLPGGMGTRKLVEDNNFLKALREIANSAKYCISICTGSAVFAKAGLLDGKNTHYTV
ncbi:MAG: DJ-1/PfpI family protein [Clostridiaceae bacterium]|nr:DJ-1/PfpI family protein [Clostridiaceae bacterium]